MENLFTNVIRWLFSFLDSVVIFVIETLYTILMKIADTNIFGDFIYEMLGRIYVFLGIFMLFKLTFSMITYIINPDDFSDKGKGFSKLITNVVISLALLVTVPSLFQTAFNLQTDVLKSNAIYQIVTGKSLSSADQDSNAEKQGKLIAYGVYSSFIYPIGADTNSTGDDTSFRAYTSDDGDERCALNDPQCLVKTSTVTAESGGKYRNEYWFLISTICGGFVAYMLLVFCLDAAVRSIKLGVLQIIAPIPILSMIDPKKGNEKVMKWAKECGKTFIDLFIRLAGIFFAITVINVLLSGDVDGAMTTWSDGAEQKNIFVKLFIIVGCLMFAKQLPQFIENILGIKLSGDGFNLKKRLGGALGGAALVGGGAMLGRALGSGARFAGHTAGAGARLGASSLKNKIQGKDNSGAMDRFKQRMDYNKTEAKGRLGSLNKKYSGDTMKSLDKKSLEAEKNFKRSEDLFEKGKKDGEYEIYSSNSFKESARLMDEAKKVRNDKQQAYDVAQARFNRGEISEEEFTKVRLDSINATSNFDKAKAAFEEQSSIHTSDAEKYKLYSAAADRHKVSESISSVPDTSTQSTTNASAATSSPTVGGVNVSAPNSNGERTTPSGIILGPSTKTDQEK